jgi:hypothetical protein
LTSNSKMLNRFLRYYFLRRANSLESDLLNYSRIQDRLGNRIKRNQFENNEEDHLSNYEEIEASVLLLRKTGKNIISKKTIIALAKSSGTTSTSKYLPITKDFLNANFEAGKDLLAMYTKAFPDTKIFSGQNFSLTGSYTIENKIVIGDISALFTFFLKPWYRPFRAPDMHTATIGDWEQKLDQMVPILAKADIRWIAGAPSWMKVVLDALECYKGMTIMEIWPNLEVFFYGGMDIAPFQNYFDEKFSNKVRYWQTYNASEGFFGIQYHKNSSSLFLLPNVNVQHFFLPHIDNPTIDQIRTADQLEIGEKYELVISNTAGLNKYRMGDLILVESQNPMRFQVVGRTKSYINTFGEELMVHNTEMAIFNLQSKIEFQITDYSVAPIIDTGGSGYHRWFIEFAKPPNDIRLFEKLLDAELSYVNSDYKAKRENDLVMQCLSVKSLPKSSFEKYLAKNNRKTVQAKIPKLWKDTEIQDQLLKLS